MTCQLADAGNLESVDGRSLASTFEAAASELD